MALRKNITGLFLSQLFTYVVPLLQFPYLTRVLEANKFGLLVFSLSMLQLSTVITDYGFDLSMTSRLSARRAKKKIYGWYLYQACIIKLVLVAAATLLLLSIFTYTDHFNDEHGFAIFILCAAIMNGFNARWLYQCLEKLYIYAYITIGLRVVFLLAVILLIKTSDDIIYYGLLLFLNAFITLLISYWIIKYNFEIRFIRASLKKTLNTFKYGFEFFLSRVGASIYTSGCSLFLGTFGSSLEQVAIYGVAEQLYKAGVQVFSPVITALTPYMVRTKNYQLFNKIVCICMSFAISGAMIGIAFGGEIIELIFGQDYVNAYDSLVIFMIVIVGSILGMLMGYPALLPIGLAKYANRSIFIAGLIQICLLFGVYILNIPVIATTIVFTYLICDWSMCIMRCICYFYYRKMVKLK